MKTATLNDKVPVKEDFLPLEGTDYVEFYVGNAKQAAHFYISAFGFQPLAYAGPETGMKDRASYAVRQNKLTFVLTTPIRKDNAIADHVYLHAFNECSSSKNTKPYFYGILKLHYGC